MTPIPQPDWKKPVYILSSMILWALVSVCMQIYFAVLNDLLNIINVWFWVCIGIGLVAGYFIGQLWYRVVYIDGRRWHGIHLH